MNSCEWCGEESGARRYCSNKCNCAHWYWKKQNGLLEPQKTPEERFFSYIFPVTESGCWLWVGPVCSHKPGREYGVIKMNGESFLAHRLSYEIHKGKIPDGLSVCHKCDVPNCINPDHLYAGTHKQNMDDMYRKGRYTRPKGSKHHKSKLTRDDVLAIRASNKTEKELAAHYDISNTHVGRIRRREFWGHIA